MSVDLSDPNSVALVHRIFPNAEVRGYTVWQRLGRRWASLLHQFGIHDDVWTYRYGMVSADDQFEEVHLTIAGDVLSHMEGGVTVIDNVRVTGTGVSRDAVLTKQLECSICHRKNGPIETM